MLRSALVVVIPLVLVVVIPRWKDDKTTKNIHTGSRIVENGFDAWWNSNIKNIYEPITRNKTHAQREREHTNTMDLQQYFLRDFQKYSLRSFSLINAHGYIFKKINVKAVLACTCARVCVCVGRYSMYLSSSRRSCVRLFTFLCFHPIIQHRDHHMSCWYDSLSTFSIKWSEM